jgi:predicted RNA-binding Zn-ribbon protein involved in translation (DUF1610 family)
MEKTDIVTCKVCNEVISVGEKFCINCGNKNPVIMRCPNCYGLMNEEKYLWKCSKCRTVLSK